MEKANAIYSIYVGRKVWICTIRGLRCANHGSVLCVTIHGFCAQSMVADNPRIVLRKQLISWFARRSSPRINYRSLRVVLAIASWFIQDTCTDCVIAFRDLCTSTACHHHAAFCLPFNESPLNELYEPVSVHGGISASSGIRFRRGASLA